MHETTTDIMTPDGAMETFSPARNAAARYPAVLMLMDAPGIREELRDMARRLATTGFQVLLPNLYYRAGRDSVFGPGVLVQGDPERERMRAIRTKMTIPPVMRDIAVMLEHLGRPGGAPRCGRRAWLLHERPLCPGRRRPLPRPHRRRRLLLRHLAGQRGRGEPASHPRHWPRASSISAAPSMTSWRHCRWSSRCAACSRPPARRASWRSIRMCITASPSRNAGASTSRRRSGIGKG